jgi:hypothetical protein
MITPEEYAVERALVDKAEAIKRALWEGWERGGMVPEVVTSHPDYRAINNVMRGRVEQYELLTNTPESFVAYVGRDRRDGMGIDRAVGSGHDLTTWAGDVVGTIRLGSGWRVRSVMGSRMYQAYARVNGRDFTGRTFGEGTSVVLRETAASKRRHAAKGV